MHSFDYLFCSYDENGELVGFRSAVWDQKLRMYVFENGIVRDPGNALGSNLLQMIVRYMLTTPANFKGRSVMAKVDESNMANKRLYENFKCRTPGFEGKQFVQSKPKGGNKRKRGGVQCVFSFKV